MADLQILIDYAQTGNKELAQSVNTLLSGEDATEKLGRALVNLRGELRGAGQVSGELGTDMARLEKDLDALRRTANSFDLDNIDFDIDIDTDIGNLDVDGFLDELNRLDNLAGSRTDAINARLRQIGVVDFDANIQGEINQLISELDGAPVRMQDEIDSINNRLRQVGNIDFSGNLDSELLQIITALDRATPRIGNEIDDINNRLGQIGHVDISDRVETELDETEAEIRDARTDVRPDVSRLRQEMNRIGEVEFANSVESELGRLERAFKEAEINTDFADGLDQAMRDIATDMAIRRQQVANEARGMRQDLEVIGQAEFSSAVDNELGQLEQAVESRRGNIDAAAGSIRDALSGIGDAVTGRGGLTGAPGGGANLGGIASALQGFTAGLNPAAAAAGVFAAAVTSAAAVAVSQGERLGEFAIEAAGWQAALGLSVEQISAVTLIMQRAGLELEDLGDFTERVSQKILDLEDGFLDGLEAAAGLPADWSDSLVELAGSGDEFAAFVEISKVLGQLEDPAVLRSSLDTLFDDDTEFASRYGRLLAFGFDVWESLFDQWEKEGVLLTESATEAGDAWQDAVQEWEKTYNTISNEATGLVNLFAGLSSGLAERVRLLFSGGDPTRTESINTLGRGRGSVATDFYQSPVSSDPVPGYGQAFPIQPYQQAQFSFGNRGGGNRFSYNPFPANAGNPFYREGFEGGAGGGYSAGGDPGLTEFFNLREGNIVFPTVQSVEGTVGLDASTIQSLGRSFAAALGVGTATNPFDIIDANEEDLLQIKPYLYGLSSASASRLSVAEANVRVLHATLKKALLEGDIDVDLPGLYPSGIGIPIFEGGE